MTEKGQIRQGDILLVPVDETPPADAMQHSHVVLAEGELTGHAHVVEAPRILTWGDMFQVASEAPGKLTHQDHDPQPAAVVVPGQTYKVVRQREYSIEGMWKQVED